MAGVPFSRLFCIHMLQTLEMVGYEVAMNGGDKREIPVRLILIIMSTLAKLASRCQDLIPRSLLCLNKIVKLSVVSLFSHFLSLLPPPLFLLCNCSFIFRSPHRSLLMRCLGEGEGVFQSEAVAEQGE